MTTSSPPVKKNDEGRSLRWFYALLPVEIAAGPVGTLIQLYILELNGTVIDVGLALTLFNAVGIPAAIIWGYVTDRFQSRKSIIVVSSVAIGGNLVLLPLVRSISGASLLYGLFSFVSAAAATPANLLIMESQRKSRWASAFAKFSMISSIGTTLGLVLGVAWSDFLPISLLAIPLATLSVASAILSFFMIKQPEIAFEREVIALAKQSFAERLRALPLVFLRIPGLVDFKSVFRGLRNTLTRQLPLLYLSIFVFYIGSGLFNTSLVPSLRAAGLSASEVFFATMVAMVAQTASFYFAGPYVERRDLRKSAVAGLLLRSVSYGAIGVLAGFSTGLTYLWGILIFYPLAGGLAFAIWYTSSNTMIFNTLGAKSQGSRLGVYSALVGVGTMIGAFVSGYISYYLGFLATFVLAAVCLVTCAVLVPAVAGTKDDLALHVG